MYQKQQIIPIKYRNHEDNFLHAHSTSSAISFSREKTIIEFNYDMNNKILAWVTEARNLEITFDSGLSSNSHITNIIKKVN